MKGKFKHMARYSFDNATTDVTTAINNGGGEMGHNALVGALEANGQSEAVKHLVNMTKQGIIVASVRATGDSAAELVYSLPS